MQCVLLRTLPLWRPWLSEDDAATVQLVFDDDREELLEPLWEIVNGKEPIRKSLLQDTCFGNVILPLPGCGSPFRSNLLNTQVLAMRSTADPRLCRRHLWTEVLSFAGIVPRPVTEVHAHPAITIIQRRTGSSCLWIDGCRFQVIGSADISVNEQIHLVQSTDILVGRHGAALAHTFFKNGDL